MAPKFGDFANPFNLGDPLGKNPFGQSVLTSLSPNPFDVGSLPAPTLASLGSPPTIIEENTRAFLNRRERELSNRIESARAVVASLERELDEVRTAKKAIDTAGDSRPHGEIQPRPAMAPSLGPDGKPSIRSLIIQAMLAKPQFLTHGATAPELREFIRDAYGREIERTSLSPQLSRLKDDGLLALTTEGVWRLTNGAADNE